MTAARATDPRRLHVAFRALLEALSRPGTLVPVEAGGDEAATTALLVESTWEPQTAIATAGDVAGALPWDCCPAPLGAAALVVAGGEDAAVVMRAARRGAEEQPEEGATVLRLRTGATAAAVRLEGPGVDGTRTCTLPLGSEELRARAEACATRPLGIDVVVVTAAGVVGLPRTTAVELLEER